MVNNFSDYKKVFDIDINQLLFQILSKPNIQQEIIEYNHEQLTQGVDSNEEKIITISAEEQAQGEVYSLFTIRERRSQGLQTRVVDLKDTGSFYNTFAVKVSKNSFEIIANYNKPDGSILDNFNDSYEFTGLTDNSLENFVWDVLYVELRKGVLRELAENASKL